MNNKTADSLTTVHSALRITQEKLLEQYVAKIKTTTNPILAFQFYQAETYILTQVRASIMQQIPTYGQLIKGRN